MESWAVALSCSGRAQRLFFGRGTEVCWARTKCVHSHLAKKERELLVQFVPTQCNNLTKGVQARWFIGLSLAQWCRADIVGHRVL